MNNIIKFEDLELPALTVIAQEQYEECLWAIEKALKKQLEFGRILLIVKSKLPHGQWGAWVRETFTDHKSLRTIQRHMRGAEAIATDPSLLESADSLDGVLKIVEERKPSVQVIEVAADVPAADVPEAAIEIVAADMPSPEVVAAVERGEITLNAAVETVKPTTATPDKSDALTFRYEKWSKKAKNWVQAEPIIASDPTVIRVLEMFKHDDTHDVTSSCMASLFQDLYSSNPPAVIALLLEHAGKRKRTQLLEKILAEPQRLQDGGQRERLICDCKECQELQSQTTQAREDHAHARRTQRHTEMSASFRQTDTQ